MKQKDTVFPNIVADNNSREEHILSKYACKSKEGIRKDPSREKIPDQDNIRPIFSHDTDKILHSKAYTRYIDKTQVFCLFENDHITHRVLHVQLVSKIGRVIGRCLKLNEDLIEAIALGHDLGHVPYGHDGEGILNKICGDNNIGLFCHNAQSVRLLMELEDKGKGLNLSLQVLDGILAHNGELPSSKYKPNYDKNWQTFEEEYNKCFEEEDYSKNLIPMTLEGCVVKISDIIAYIGRDLDDANTLNVTRWDNIPKEITKVLGSRNDKIINTLVEDIINNSYGNNYLCFSDSVFRALDDLLKFNLKFIYNNPKINTESPKIENMFQLLFQIYCLDLAKNIKDSPVYDFIHDMDDVYIKNTDNKRIAIDYISGMTDDFFYHQYQELFVPQRYGYSLKNGAND